MEATAVVKVSDTYKFKTVPYEHQNVAFDMQCKNKYFALLADLGTGKTKIALDTAAYMYDQGWIDAIMVFGNNGSYTNWIEGVTEHLPAHIKYTIGVWSSRNKKKDWDNMYKAINSKEMGLKIFLMNVEAIAFPKGFKHAYDFVKAHKTFTVVDESTTIANPDAARTKAMMKIRDVSRVRRILTGSAVDNRPLDAWSQFQFLANGALGYTSYYSFRAQYACLEDLKIQRGGVLRSFKVVQGYKNLDRLKESIAKCSFIVKKEDCLDLPPKTFMDYNVDLTDEQEKMYESLRQRAIAEVQNEAGENSLVTVKIALTKMLRLHQFVCGHTKDDDGVVHSIPSNRLKALEAVLDEAQGKVVIWTSFTYDVEAISAFLEKKYGKQSFLTYYGATSNEERERVKEVFKRGREVDSIRFLIANDKTGGYGNNFTAITTAVYYSYDFDNNVHHQTQDRIHRIGQTEPVTYVYLKAKGTIDEKILQVLKGKMTVAELITPSNWKENFL